MGCKEKEFVSSLIEECIRRYDEKYDRETYLKHLNEIKQLSIEDIPKNMNLIRGYLYDWGNMHWVLKRERYRGWELRLGELVIKHSGKLKMFRNKNLVETDLRMHENEIKELYNSFRQVVGPTSAVKILHIICPNFFPLWDNDIAKCVANFGGYSKYDYFKFMMEIQRILGKYGEVISKLTKESGEGMLRTLDKYLYWFSKNPLIIIE